MFYLAYNTLSVLLLFPVIVYHLYRSLSRGRKPAFAERFGFIPSAEINKLKGHPVIWLHAVSVGESIAARPLLKALREQYPAYSIVISNTTETGRAVASGYPEKDLCIYFPFDFLPSVRTALNRVKPQLVIIMETEIWPNFNREAAVRKIPVILANGRISDRSLPRYLKFSWFFRHPLHYFSDLCMQTELDRERIIAVGAPPERTIASGNLKYDIPFSPVGREEKHLLRQHYGIPEKLPVIVAASTHAGEEELLLVVYRQLLKTIPEIFMVLVPRHPERAAEVALLLEQSALRYRRRTQMTEESQPLSAGEVLLVDTVGEMMKLYALSDISFVGGSLAATGGHNLLEPASRGIPCIFGPHMSNFREIAALVLHYGSGIKVETADELLEVFRNMILSQEVRQVLGNNGLKLMRDNGGATAIHLDVAGKYL